MRQLSTTAKENIIQKALGKEATLREIAEVYNIGLSTLKNWVKTYKESGKIYGDKTGKNQEIELKQHMKHIIATTGMNEIEVGIYCRENGLYSYQLTEWKENIMQEKNREESWDMQIKKLRKENSELKKQIHKKQSEINRKDKAMAEMAAWIVLKKKAQLLWGDREDD